jgi:hypothetical protein
MFKWQEKKLEDIAFCKADSCLVFIARTQQLGFNAC